MATIQDVVVDSRHPGTLARFWASVLDDYQVAPYDEAEIARLQANGIDDITDDPTVLVEPTSGRGLRIWFQQVPEPKVLKNRIHLDLEAEDPEVELRRLLGLGATQPADQPWKDGWCLLDPEGNEFCLAR